MRLLLFFLFLSLKGVSQKNDSVDCSSKTLIPVDNIQVFIKGKKGVKSIKRKFFRKPFHLMASDPTYAIVSFRLMWERRQKNMLVKRSNYGSIVKPDFKEVNFEARELYSLKNLEPGTFLAFDCIIIKKGDTYYKVSPFIINVLL